MVHVAVPLVNETFDDAHPPVKLTVPAGVPLPGAVAVTVAVKVRDCPETAGLAEDENSTRVDAAVGAETDTAEEVLVAKFVSPE